MKTKKEILQDLQSDCISEQDQVTYFGKSGVLRAILSGVASVAQEIWNDIFQVKRQIQEDTSTGSDLDTYEARRGLTRLGATKSSVILLFNGPSGTVIPANSTLTSTVSGEQYQTLYDVTLGTQNPNMQRPVTSNSIGDIVIAESLNTGSQTAIGVKELIALDVPITGVTVTNLVPSVGGLDSETDDQFRARGKEQNDLLNQGTEAFYEAMAKSAETTVLMAKAITGTSGGTDVYLVKNSLSVYNDTQLTGIANAIYTQQRAFNTVTCKNASLLDIEVLTNLIIKSGYDSNTVFSNVASAIANYVDNIRDWGATIKYEDLLVVILAAEGVDKMVLANYYLNNGKVDVACAENQIPVFTYLSITSLQGNVNQAINQSYLIIQ